MTNVEARMTKGAIPIAAPYLIGGPLDGPFVIRISSFFRHSSLDFRHFRSAGARLSVFKNASVVSTCCTPVG